MPNASVTIRCPRCDDSLAIPVEADPGQPGTYFSPPETPEILSFDPEALRCNECEWTDEEYQLAEAALWRAKIDWPELDDPYDTLEEARGDR